MQCQTRDEIEEHLSDIRVIAARVDLTTEEKEAAFRAERFAIALLKQHDTAGHWEGMPSRDSTLASITRRLFQEAGPGH
jgi:phage FluMu gp28-like protein